MTPERRLAVLLPMRMEYGALRRCAAGPVEPLDGEQSGWRLEVAGVPFQAVITGQGPVRARRAARWAIRILRPQAIVVAGIAGGTQPGQAPGDLAVLAEADRWADGRFAGPRAAGDARLADAVQDALTPTGRRVDRGLGAGVSWVAQGTLKQRLGTLGAVAVDMESYWVLATAAETGVPAVGLRAVVDVADRDVPRSLAALSGLQGGRWWPEIASIWRLPLELPAVWRARRDLETGLRSLSLALEACLPAVAKVTR